MSRYWQTLAIVVALSMVGSDRTDWVFFLQLTVLGWFVLMTGLACKREDAATRNRTLT